MTSAEKKTIWMCGAKALPEFAAAEKWLEERFELAAYDLADLMFQQFVDSL